MFDMFIYFEEKNNLFYLNYISCFVNSLIVIHRYVLFNDEKREKTMIEQSTHKKTIFEREQTTKKISDNYELHDLFKCLDLFI